ncbi:hypothetical protein BC826DRAFT_1188297 [Russula brevipes]|nr:hypothetical protein BC826DRAFT_1188297 [Russula brevipes]
MKQIAERHPSHAQNTSTARFLHESARAVALFKVDGEIDAAMPLTQARTLLAHHNTLAPVSVLPPEVLARIFHLVALAEWSWFDMENLRWISVTQMLARARNAPLAVDLREMPNAETTAMFLPHFAHTHEIRLRGLFTDRLHIDDNVRDICSLEAPALEHFELSLSCAFPVIFLGAPFFNGVAPKLRTFSLSQLTQLKITLTGTRRSIADGPSLGDSKSLIDLLINCPVLEILVLKFCLPPVSHDPRMYKQSIFLASHICPLLPPSTTLHMDCTSENTATHNDHHLLPLVSAHFHDPTSVEMKRFNVVFYPMERFINFAACTYLPVSEGDVNGGAELTLSYEALPEAENGVDILGRVCSMLPISNIEFLSIRVPDVVRSVNWGEHFQRCTKLTTIEATGCGINGLPKELTPPEPRKAPPDGEGRKKKLDNRGVPAPASSCNPATVDTPVPIFPRLTSLFLRNIGFGEPGRRPEVLYDALSTMLRWRRACKAPLRVLRIDNCPITTDRANALGKFVPEFLWNGHKGASLDEFDEFDDLSDE